MSVRPYSSGGVTVVLPVTTDCNADGAICTGDGRKLSEQVEVTVSGPESLCFQQSRDRSTHHYWDGAGGRNADRRQRRGFPTKTG